MININLLPWREAIQKRLTRKTIIGITLELVLTTFICVIIYFYASYRATSAGPNRSMLNSAIAQTNAQIKQLTSQNKGFKKVLNQKKLLTSLHDHKFQALTMLQEINTALPKTINLDRIVFQDSELNLYGAATTNKQVTEFINNLSKSDVIKNPILKESKTLTKKDTIYIKFQIEAQVNSKYKDLQEKVDAKNKK